MGNRDQPPQYVGNAPNPHGSCAGLKLVVDRSVCPRARFAAGYDEFGNPELRKGVVPQPPTCLRAWRHVKDGMCDHRSALCCKPENDTRAVSFHAQRRGVTGVQDKAVEDKRRRVSMWAQAASPIAICVDGRWPEHIFGDRVAHANNTQSVGVSRFCTEVCKA